VRGIFQETAPRKTAENTVKHRDGGVGSVVADHRGGDVSSAVVTTLQAPTPTSGLASFFLCPPLDC